MRDAVHHRQASFTKFRLQHGCIHLLRVAFFAAFLQVLNRGEHACGQNRRKRSSEDETRCIRADAIDDLLVGRDIAAHHAERLA